MTEYKPEEFWTRRFEKCGHTGYEDPLYYSYSQPLRIKAVRKALQRLHLVIDDDVQVLDVGCGSGDFIEEFSKMGAHVTGVDVSRSLVNWTKRRFFNQSNVKVEVGKAEHLRFASNSFDLVLSITVLQHIADPVCFEKAVNNMIRVTKHGGHVLILEMSPDYYHETSHPPYLSVRKRNEWIRSFETKDCRLVLETPVPELGIHFLESFDTLLRRFYRKSGGHLTLPREKWEEAFDSKERHTLTLNRIRNLMRKVMLLVVKPLDYLFLPLFPKDYSDLHILIFERAEVTIT